jgi:hypothetical protein
MGKKEDVSVDTRSVVNEGTEKRKKKKQKKKKKTAAKQVSVAHVSIG